MSSQKDPGVLLKTQQLVGYLYSSGKSNKAIIYLKGGPSFGDLGQTNVWGVAKRFGWDIFIPDYIGHSRSDGSFSFKHCVETIFQAHDFLTGKKSGLIVESGKIIKANYHEVIVVGSSWGGAIAPFLEKYLPSTIQCVALIKPVVDWTTQGKAGKKEENVEETNRYIINGLENIYRGYKDSEWPQIFLGKSKEFNPVDNIHLLKDKTVFICHGNRDHSIYWKKSFAYYKKLKQTYPAGKFFWKKLIGGHNSETNIDAFRFILSNVNKLHA